MLQQKGITSKMVLLLLFMVYAVLSSGGLVLFKLGGQEAALQLGKTGFSVTLSWKMLLGVFCYLCSFLLWLAIVARTQLTFAMPLSVGVVNILVFLGSAKFLGEEITSTKIVGLAVIVLGLFLISVPKK